MAKLHWRLSETPARLKMGFLDCFENIRLTYMSLFYNQFNSWNTCVDTAFEPLFWFVDHTARFIGPLMVSIVVFMMTLGVATVYVCIVPHIYYQSELSWVIVHLIFAHWLLINTLFNYFMAVFTKPGHPPQAVDEVVSICKKCISPKPPRTHHCTVCGTCILKMDHHCPWINNCIGFYNHRYFFLFVAYMWLGTMYVSVAGYDVFKQHFFGNKELIVPAFFFPINLAYHAWTEYQEGKPSVSTSLHDSHQDEMNVTINEDVRVTMEGQFLHNVIIIVFLLSAGVSVALSLLGAWHALLITQGQTSIEQHINKKEKSRLKKKNVVFRNPYNFGFVQNWRLFLGLRRGRSFARHILLPSCHDPEGDGISWKTATFSLERKSYLELL